MYLALADTAAARNRCLDAAWFRDMAESRSSHSEEAPTVLQAECVTANPHAAAVLNEKAAQRALRKRDLDAANAHYEEARRIWQLQGVAFAEARSLAALVRLASFSDQLERARELGNAAIGLLPAGHAPGSTLAEVHHQLGNAELFSGGELAEAGEHHRAALAIRSALEPGSRFEAASLGSLSTVAWRRDELIAATDYVERALAIFESLEPGSRSVGAALGTLGNIAHERRDYAAAVDYRLRALAIFEREAPGSRGVANLLMGLGTIASRRGNHADAEERLLQAKQIYTDLDQKRELAIVAHNLSGLYSRQGDPDRAKAYLDEAIAIEAQLNVDDWHRARSLVHAGELARKRGDFAAAQGAFDQAVAIYGQVSPDGLMMSWGLHLVALTKEQSGNGEAGRADLERALAIGQALAPGTLYEALPLHRLGRLHEAAGDDDGALDLYARALDAFEAQRELIGGTETAQGRFAERYKFFYSDYLALLQSLGRTAEAFDVSERYRARVLLDIWTERSPGASELPLALREQYGKAARGYSRAVEALAGARGVEPAQRQALLAEIDEWRQQRADVEAEIRALAPRLSEISQPRPLALQEAIDSLAPGTIALSFFVADDATFAFVLDRASENGSPEAAQVLRLNGGEADLGEAVSALRTLIQVPDAGVIESLQANAAALYDTLLRPIDGLDRAERLLLVTDGPLHYLPFAALVSDVESRRYLVEDVALHKAHSLSTYALMREAGNAAEIETVTLLANPANVGVTLPPLPGAESEAQAIARVYPRTSELFTGEKATEALARERATAAGILHFATHALPDAMSPLDSYLVLAPTGIDDASDGLLAAWEIADGPMIGAQLVTLSGCSTELGADAGGEGLIGLTHAFHFAGARDVVASLWQISDATTPHVMREFYDSLARGMPVDAALRSAQLDAIRHRPPLLQRVREGLGLVDAADLAHPDYCAAFQVSGPVL